MYNKSRIFKDAINKFDIGIQLENEYHSQKGECIHHS